MQNRNRKVEPDPTNRLVHTGRQLGKLRIMTGLSLCFQLAERNKNFVVDIGSQGKSGAIIGFYQTPVSQLKLLLRLFELSQGRSLFNNSLLKVAVQSFQFGLRLFQVAPHPPEGSTQDANFIFNTRFPNFHIQIACPNLLRYERQFPDRMDDVPIQINKDSQGAQQD
jgi:hypothetical protein